jgi:hypothetical protein
VEEQRNGEQLPPAEPAQDAQRNLPMTIVETAAALKLVDQVVPDLYGAAKGAAKKVIGKVSGDQGPDTTHQGPGSG